MGGPSRTPRKPGNSVRAAGGSRARPRLESFAYLWNTLPWFLPPPPTKHIGGFGSRRQTPGPVIRLTSVPGDPDAPETVRREVAPLIKEMVRRAEEERAFWHRSSRPDISEAERVRGLIADPMAGILGEFGTYVIDRNVDALCSKVLLLPRGDRWREAVSTALAGSWCKGHSEPLPDGALRDLKAEARAIHRELVPIWRRRTRQGRVLSLDADLGDGLSLHDLVATDVDLLTHTPGGVFEDERLDRVLCALLPDEQRVVIAYAEGEGSTWTEAAAVAGAADPEAFGERVRRKAKRQAAEQHRRAALQQPHTP